MKYKIKNNHIYMEDANTIIANKIDMVRLGKHWKVQDDAIRRVFLNIPLEVCKPKKMVINEPKLYPFQREDIEQMVSKGKMLNANTMGLGKTVETIITMDVLGSELNLIICPKSVRGTWKNELKKWLDVPEKDINIIEGTPKERAEAARNLKKYNIINYELLRNTTSDIMKILRATNWDTVVCDEAHRIKNRNAKQTKGVKSLKSKYRYALTGTPIQNRPDDLWSILQWLDPFLSGRSYWRFVNLFCEVEKDFFGMQIRGLTPIPKHQEALKTILNDIMIRRTNDASLPDKITIPISLEMTKQQKKLYKDISEEILVELQNNGQLFINSALTRLIRLQQCTSNTQKFGLKENPKFDFIRDLVEDNPEEKIVVFSRFRETITSLNKYIKGNHAVLTGDTENRDEVLEQFRNNKNTQLFLATIGAAGEGIDGLQESSNIMVFIDKEWSPARNSQAVGRLVRNGQKNKVRVFELSMTDSIDEHVEDITNKKIADIIQVLGQNAT